MITRVTQRMLTGRELTSVETASTRMAKAQEQMTTGKKINRPSDDPAHLSTALKARSGITQQTQYQRNADDGIAWLSTIDTTIQSATTQVRRAYTLAVQGANTATASSSSNEALADEIDQITQSVMGLANTTYLGRPVFGGTTAGGTAYTQDPTTGAISYVGDGGKVERRVGDGTVVRVDSSATAVFGDGTSAGGDVFQHLQDLSAALRAGSSSGIETAIGVLQNDMTRFSSALADEGARMNQITAATNVSKDTTLALQTVQTNIEDVDIAQATINLQTQNTAYQAALTAVAKTSQQSLLDYLR